MFQQLVINKSRHVVPLISLFRQMHIGSGGVSRSLRGTGEMTELSKFSLNQYIFSKSQNYRILSSCRVSKYTKDESELSSYSPMVLQSRQGILEIPINSLIRPSIGIPPDMLRRSEYRTPIVPNIITPIEIPTTHSNQEKEIEDSPTGPARIEKQAVRLIVIRRSKMNKHKLRKLRKKMKYVYAKIKLRRAIRKEKAYLNSKMELINAAKAFDAKQYVADIIKRAKEEPIPEKWTDPLMPEWFKEQEMKKEAWQKRYQKMINLYLNQSITIDFRTKKKLK